MNKSLKWLFGGLGATIVGVLLSFQLASNETTAETISKQTNNNSVNNISHSSRETIKQRDNMNINNNNGIAIKGGNSGPINQANSYD